MKKIIKSYYEQIFFKTILLLVIFTAGITSSHKVNAAASTMVFGQTYAGQFSIAATQDSYNVVLASAGKLNFTVQTAGKCSLVVTGSGGVYKLIEHQGAGKTYGMRLAAGTYNVFVKNAQSDASSYRLKAEFSKAVTTASRPCKTLGDACKVTMGQTILGQIAINDEVDVYKFRVSAGRLTLAYSSKELHGYENIVLLDQKGETIYRWGSQIIKKGIGTLDLKGGEYYLRLESPSYKDDEGTYTLKTKFTNHKETFKTFDNTLGRAPAFGMNRTIYGHMAIDDGTDIYKIKVPKGKWNLSLGGHVWSMDVEVLNSSGKRVWKDDYYNLYELETREDNYSLNLKAGTYYLRFTNSWNIKGGSYHFRLSKPVKMISMNDISIASISDRVYTGKNINPVPKVKNGSRLLKKNVHYTLRYVNNLKPGKATIAVSGNGLYKGGRKKDFIIVPKSTSITTVGSRASKTASLSFKGSVGASGYQVVYSDNKTGYHNGGHTGKTSLTVKNLTSGKFYYMRVRPYVTVKGKKHYGGYSATKVVKVL